MTDRNFLYAYMSHQLIDFKPDNSWDAWFFDHERPIVNVAHVVGWEIQAETMIDADTYEPLLNQPPLTERPRRAVMVTMSMNGDRDDIHRGDDFWQVVPRGTPLPEHNELEEGWLEWKRYQ